MLFREAVPIGKILYIQFQDLISINKKERTILQRKKIYLNSKAKLKRMERKEAKLAFFFFKF